MEQKEVIELEQMAIEHYGAEKQTRKAIEEMAELITDNQGFCTSKGHEVNDYSELLSWFRWLDNSPCGIKEE